jgi:uncharacterized protein (TIGR02186 family)
MRVINKLNILFALSISSLMILIFVSDSFSITSNVSPDTISVNSFYRGSKVTITGETDAGNEIIIKVSSPEVKAHLRKKGKAGGVLWMNVGELEFNPASDVYFIYSTKDIKEILSEKEQDKYSIGYDAFKRLVEVSPVSGESEKERWIAEFIRFKEKGHIYGVFQGKIETMTIGSKITYNLTEGWPYEAPPMEYKISVYAVKDGAVTDSTEESLVVEKTGILKFLSDMAFNHEIIYGIIAIIIAVVAGFIVSLLFKGGGGGH